MSGGRFVMKEINKIINDFWNDYVAKKKDSDLSGIIEGIPLVWHGNMDSYFSSKRRIVTVSLNPHYDAFDPDEEQFNESGHKLIKHLESVDKLSETDIDALKKLYNEYFINNLKASEDPIFKGYKNLFFDILNASYFNEKGKNQVLHIDAATAIATNPVWRKISGRQKRKIKNIELTKQFIDFLKPNIILFSSNNKDLNEIIDNYYQEEEYELKYEEKNSRGKSVKIYSDVGKNKVIVFGSNNFEPFKGVNNEIIHRLVDQLKIFLEV